MVIVASGGGVSGGDGSGDGGGDINIAHSGDSVPDDGDAPACGAGCNGADEDQYTCGYYAVGNVGGDDAGGCVGDDMAGVELVLVATLSLVVVELVVLMITMITGVWHGGEGGFGAGHRNCGESL